MPDSKLKKSYKGFISVLTIFMFLSPFSELKNLSEIIEKTDFKYGITEEKLLLESSNVILDCAEDLLDSRLNEILDFAELEGYCKTYIKEINGEAYIDKINIYGEFSFDEEKIIISLINEAVGGDAEIEFVG